MPSLLFTDPFQIVNDCKLVSKAARLGWPIPVEDKIAILKRLQDIVENSEEEREAISAAKAIMMADGINAKREAARQAKRMAKTSGVNVTVNTAVQVNAHVPATIERRTDEALALLDAARARAVLDSASTATNQILLESTSPAAEPLPSDGVP